MERLSQWIRSFRPPQSRQMAVATENAVNILGFRGLISDLHQEALLPWISRR